MNERRMNKANLGIGTPKLNSKLFSHHMILNLTWVRPVATTPCMANMEPNCQDLGEDWWGNKYRVMYTFCSLSLKVIRPGVKKHRLLPEIYYIDQSQNDYQCFIWVMTFRQESLFNYFHVSRAYLGNLIRLSGFHRHCHNNSFQPPIPCNSTFFVSLFIPNSNPSICHNSVEILPVSLFFKTIVCYP